MRLSESGNRHYTDDEIECVIKKLLDVGRYDYTYDGKPEHTSYGRVMEQLKRERDQALTEVERLRAKYESRCACGNAKPKIYRECEGCHSTAHPTDGEDDCQSCSGSGVVESSVNAGEEEYCRCDEGQRLMVEEAGDNGTSHQESGEPWTEECEASIKRALAKEWTDE